MENTKLWRYGKANISALHNRNPDHLVRREYDRRAVNGASFVCFGQKILSADEPRCAEMIAYQKRVIDALGIRNGPTHGEVKWFQGDVTINPAHKTIISECCVSDEPVLVEVGARCHGGEGAWCDVASEVFGYNQAEATILAYLDPIGFAKLPSLVLFHAQHSRCVHDRYCTCRLAVGAKRFRLHEMDCCDGVSGDFETSGPGSLE